MKTTTIAFVTTMLLLVGACEKGNPVEDQSLAFLDLHLIDLPGSPALDVYIGNIKLKDSLYAYVVPIYPRQLLLADKPTRITFRKKGVDAILLDTNIVLESGQKRTLRLAFSEELGMKSFLQPSTFGVDSIAFQMYNSLPTAIQADSLQVNAELFRIHPVTGAFELLTEFENYHRLKLHPKRMVLPLKENDVEITYFLMFKNVKTGAYLTDLTGDILGLGGFAVGQEHILKIYADSVDLGNGPLYFFYALPIEL